MLSNIGRRITVNIVMVIIFSTLYLIPLSDCLASKVDIMIKTRTPSCTDNSLTYTTPNSGNKLENSN